MKTDRLYETNTPAHLYEEDVARRWWALSSGALLPLSNGDVYQLVFVGRPGSACGPDVRDAILRPGFSRLHTTCDTTPYRWGQNRVGDVEFHVRSSDWCTHLHSTDARYNNVILHVVLILDDFGPTLRQDGTIIPTCSLNDLFHLPYTTNLATNWPCQHVMRQMSEEERTGLLRHAGLLRFEQKTHAFVELLHDSQPQGPFSVYDVCLIPALAEGLGYGRDRALFRAAGRYLVGLVDMAPEPLGRTPDPPPLDAQRLRILRNLVAQWRTCGAWQTLRKAIYPGATSNAPTTILTLRAVFSELSNARTDILICNIVLPFAAAVALLEHDEILSEQARMLYMHYPGLSSNQITRAMSKQLQLSAEPHGACQQQGLHYIYQQTCREKRCDMCIAGKRDI